MGNSTHFGAAKKLSGRPHRDGSPYSDQINDVYSDVDSGFVALEAEMRLGGSTVVRARTTGALPANTYDNVPSAPTITADGNGALGAQDGVTLVAGEMLLVFNEGDASNGVYTVTDVGSGATPFILTRHSSMPKGLGAANYHIRVSEGTTHGDTVWTVTNNAGADVVGTATLAFGQAIATIPGAASLTAAMLVDDTLDAAAVSTAGAGGKFAAGAITAAGASHLFAADSIDNAFVQASFAAGAFGADADSRAAFATDFVNAATADDIIAVDSLGEDLLTPDEIGGRVLTPGAIVTATGAVVPSVPVSFVLDIPDAGSSAFDLTLPASFGMLITSASVVKIGGDNGANANTVQIQTAGGAANVSNVLDMQTAKAGGGPLLDTDVAFFTQLDDANCLFAAGGSVIRINHVKAGGDAAVRVIVNGLVV
jgi:hypothetical protein